MQLFWCVSSLLMDRAVYFTLWSLFRLESTSNEKWWKESPRKIKTTTSGKAVAGLLGKGRLTSSDLGGRLFLLKKEVQHNLGTQGSQNNWNLPIYVSILTFMVTFFLINYSILTGETPEVGNIICPTGPLHESWDGNLKPWLTIFFPEVLWVIFTLYQSDSSCYVQANTWPIKVLTSISTWLRLSIGDHLKDLSLTLYAIEYH